MGENDGGQLLGTSTPEAISIKAITYLITFTRQRRERRTWGVNSPLVSQDSSRSYHIGCFTSLQNKIVKMLHAFWPGLIRSRMAQKSLVESRYLVTRTASLESESPY